MPHNFNIQKLGESGVAHLLLIIAAIGVLATILITSTFSFDNELFRKLFVRERSYASSDTIMIVNDSGTPIYETTSSTVKLKFQSPSWVASSDSNFSLIKEANAQTSQGNLVTVSGKFTGVNNMKLVDTCSNATVSYNTSNQFVFRVAKGASFCIRATDAAGFTKLATNSRTNPKMNSYEWQVAGINCATFNGLVCRDGQKKQMDLASDITFDFSYTKIATASPSPTASPSATPTPPPPPPPPGATTQTVMIAENPSLTLNLKVIPFTTDLVSYTFSSSTPGNKTIYAKFISTSGSEQNAVPFPARIELKSISGPISNPL